MKGRKSPSAAVRSELEHPVIDSDGHIREFTPAAMPYVRDALGPKLFEHVRSHGLVMDGALARLPFEERWDMRLPQVAWWAQPSRNMLDRATASIPRLMYERLDDFGIDYAVLYPSNSLGVAGHHDEDLRLGLCRGFNDFFIDQYGEFVDRMTVAAMIPMHTPDEAIRELSYCKERGFKAVGIPQEVIRPIPKPNIGPRTPWLWPGQTHWADTYGLDSLYDYDPVWAKFQELGFAVNSHGAISLSPRIYNSVSNFTSNHAGSFAQMMFSLCKSIYIGGVTRRFPRLPFAFLECGVGWACTLLANIEEIWEKRNLQGLENTNPANLDAKVFEGYLREYGGHLLDRLPESDITGLVESVFRAGPQPAELNDFIHMGADKKDDLRDLFESHFYFGCEGDDRTTAFAFSPANAFEARLQVILSSDISHWDVPELERVMVDTKKLLDKGLMNEEEFREFLFINPAKLYTSVAPDFFVGTVLESDVSKLGFTGVAG